MLSIEKFKIKEKEVTIAVLWDNKKIDGIAYSLEGNIELSIKRLSKFLARRGVKVNLKLVDSKYPSIVYEVLIGKISNAQGFAQLSLRGLTEFEKKVYEWLVKNVKRGQVITYSELAKALETSPRAIGGAMKRNPYPIIVPCHRVIGKTNQWLYTPKPEYKRFLLEVEGWIS
ncbi:methylated-DNA--protein-cysteine methyltransferase [Pyrococcus kukulkanii]|uniref:methylated-DNA--protein-cysteine methyltransferase n=1 Tax=Pyrococcus kukulkanii TaxID=1609559 RepID=UPI0035689054